MLFKFLILLSFYRKLVLKNRSSMSNLPLKSLHASGDKVEYIFSFKDDQANIKQKDNVIKSDTAIGNDQNLTGSAYFVRTYFFEI